MNVPPTSLMAHDDWVRSEDGGFVRAGSSHALTNLLPTGQAEVQMTKPLRPEDVTALENELSANTTIARLVLLGKPWPAPARASRA